MKRIIYTLVVLLLGGGTPLSAQDTIDCPPANYFCKDWPGDSIDISTENIYFSSSYITAYNSTQDGPEFAKPLFTDSTLTVYGIAVGLVSMSTTGPCSAEDVIDTSVYNDSCYEYVDIYYREGLHSMQRVARAKVKYEPTPAHYVIINSPTQFDKGPHPIFEAYFEKPIEVHDTFYAGVTQHLRNQYQTSPFEYKYTTWPLNLLILEDVKHGELVNCDTYALFNNGKWFFTGYDYENEFHGMLHQFGYIFPITTPPPPPNPNPPAGIDDTEVNGIHLATRDGRIAVQGLTPGRQAEVFDMMGRRQAALATDGLTPPLPQGVYVVRAGHNWSRKVVLIK